MGAHDRRLKRALLLTRLSYASGIEKGCRRELEPATGVEPATRCLQRSRSTIELHRHGRMAEGARFQLAIRQRANAGVQSRCVQALRQPSKANWCVERPGSPRHPLWQRGILDPSELPTRGCRGRTRTGGLHVMSVTSCQLLHPAMEMVPGSGAYPLLPP